MNLTSQASNNICCRGCILLSLQIPSYLYIDSILNSSTESHGGVRLHSISSYIKQIRTEMIYGMVRHRLPTNLGVRNSGQVPEKCKRSSQTL